MISSCPLLEKFTMERCIMRHINVVEILAANVKHMIFDNIGRGTFHDHRSFGGVLKVVAPKFVTFVYYGYVLRNFQMENLSSLQSASIHFLDSREQPDHYFCSMVKGFYNANVLRLTIPFFQLCFNGAPEEPWFEAVSCLGSSLKRIELINSCGTEMELEFVKKFMACGKVFEEFAIPLTQTMETSASKAVLV
ncbi:uncharacterized protein LOC130783543 isoform X2 [Actinidia eriantha]|uniref:uncharacterized protein LOC130783543 isoform X2 n=1 Tax=Actinidia eriantha TaxID=165200 RepID=UPI0025880B6C|nr:uncharacterized protein LOC130783543 isoform X2 [Actinidia eriantha]